MKLLLILSMVTIAFIPSAAADHDVCPSWDTCVVTQADGYGSCDTAGYEYNYAVAQLYRAGVGSAYAGAQTYCYAYDYWGYQYDGSGIVAVGSANVNGVGGAYAVVYWYGWGGDFGSGCYTFVAADTSLTPAVIQAPGCPAGNPPAVPALIP